ncbi:carboxypeptidase-like regulatory domain-containing protein [Spirosoma foliorum]|uniref:Carboxypeptidase-like regulatory domain-containing protein n=1 Tax=Spirosoma foliorum TaxID=2710596 RepID=A0A7G5GQ98_9BACT|nr:carboxypeptidase-like regulatory domain-containing protein [Spirosoma foliorum]QMW01040.1 carboxypeptidase-like regulatory domain-containing protein [Spirosoma foliorum]
MHKILAKKWQRVLCMGCFQLALGSFTVSYGSPGKLTNVIGRGHLNVVEQPTDRAISGTVADESGVGLPGVSVLVKGTQRGTVTDKDGVYRLTVPDGAATITFSFVGYTSQDVAISNQAVVNITLRPEMKSLDEVVVVGYGTARKKRSHRRCDVRYG